MVKERSKNQIGLTSLLFHFLNHRRLGQREVLMGRRLTVYQREILMAWWWGSQLDLGRARRKHHSGLGPGEVIYGRMEVECLMRLEMCMDHLMGQEMIRKMVREILSEDPFVDHQGRGRVYRGVYYYFFVVGAVFVKAGGPGGILGMGNLDGAYDGF